MMIRKKLFLASSAELREDRTEFEIFINRKNKDWLDKGVFLDLVVWEDFLDAVSKTRLQDEYHEAIRECDLFVMLFFTKVGKYTEEEFETAFGQFQATSKPFIFTYFKDAEISIGSVNKKDLMSVLAFQAKLDALGHFHTRYKNSDELKFHFNRQLDKLVAEGFIEFRPDKEAAVATRSTTYNANVAGSGAIAQGAGATAIGARGVLVGGNNTGNINTGAQSHVDTGGGAYIKGDVSTGGGDFVGRDKHTEGLAATDLEPLFAPVLAAVAQHAPPSRQAAALEQVEALKAETAKGRQADDGKLAKVVDGLAAMAPGAIGSIVGLFTTPILRGIVRPATKLVLDKLRID
jgi:hypothetical protein